MDDPSPRETPPDTPSGAMLSPPIFLKARYITEKLEEAELLLGYAAVSGIEVDDDVRDGILQARLAGDAGCITEKIAANLLAALTSLASSVRPVSAASLRASANIEGGRRMIRFYGIIAGLVAAAIIMISMATYFSSSVSDKIKADIDIANGLASKLRSELGPSPSDVAGPRAPATAAAVPAPAPAPERVTDLAQADKVWYGTDTTPPGLSDRDIISDLQQFAASMREIDGYVKQLRYFVLDFDDTKYARAKGSLELDAGLDLRLSDELTRKVTEYQHVRNLGNSVQEKVTVYYGAVATCILPVLYSLLGAGAYLLRAFEYQIKNRTLVAGNRHVARFLIAGIGGLVVGLFNNFTTQGITFSPFAVAFLVGYAADVFFTFLEGLLQIFKRAPAGSAGSAAAAADNSP
jgi:hypothetical protein